MAAGLTFRWEVPPSVLADAAGKLKPAVEASMRSEGPAMAQTLDAYASSHHPWSNVTGQAEAGLTTDVQVNGSGLTIELYNTTFHGNGLEIWRGGKWGVIRPAMTANAAAAKAMMERIVAKGMGG